MEGLDLELRVVENLLGSAEPKATRSEELPSILKLSEALSRHTLVC